MNILALETCSPTGGVSLMIEGRIIGHTFITTSRAHSLLLCDSIQKLMELSSVSWDDIHAVAVSEGPGSFTGVRLGLTVAKAFCLSGHPKLIMVPTFEAFANRMYRNQDVRFVMPTLNARRNELYAQFFEVSHGMLKKVSEPLVCNPAESPKPFETLVSGEKILIAGEGFRSYHKELESAFGEHIIEADHDLFDPHPDGIANMAVKYFERGKFTDSNSAVPFYLREPSVSTPKKNKISL